MTSPGWSAFPPLDEAELAVHGLAQHEVAARNRAGLTNASPRGSSRSFWHILRANLVTLFNAVVGASTFVLLLFGDWRDGLFGLTALANVLIGVLQEFRAKRLLDSMRVRIFQESFDDVL